MRERDIWSPIRRPNLTLLLPTITLYAGLPDHPVAASAGVARRPTPALADYHALCDPLHASWRRDHDTAMQDGVMPESGRGVFSSKA